MASGIVSRKKRSRADADADAGGASETGTLIDSFIVLLDGDKPPATSDADEMRGFKNGITRRKKALDYVLIAAIVFLVVILSYLITAPADKMAAHQDAVNKQLEQLSTSLQEKKKSWVAKRDELVSKLQLDQKKLDQMTGSVSFVPKDHHEEEVGALLSRHEEEVGKLKSQHEEEVGKLQLQISQKQANIEALVATIKKNEGELKKVKSKMDGMEEDVGLFCAECPFNVGGLRTSCGARKNYLMTRHKDSEEVATEAVMKMDPNCKKKAER